MSDTLLAGPEAAGVQRASTVKDQLLSTLRHPMVAAPFRRLLRGRATVFMLHRFRDDSRGVEGQSPESLLAALDYLRRNRYELVGLEELYQRLGGAGPPLRGAVAFTIDDGYYDQATIAAPIFAEFDCPVTTFVTSGFLDRSLWFWWDRIAYAFQKSPSSEVRVALAGVDIRYSLATAAERERSRADFTERCKVVREEEKLVALEGLGPALEVEIPASAPPGYAPMTWDQLRSCEQMGMTFGPHTVTHPVLSRTTDEQSRYEIVESWRRLREEASAPLPVFCYPNGQFSDFGARELATMGEAGITGAVVGAAGYATASTFSQAPEESYKVRRFAMSDSLPLTIQCVSGVERFKQILRNSPE